MELSNGRVCTNTGSLRDLDVIDVARQDDIKMKMREWVQYYESEPRSKILNVISLEFSDTRYVILNVHVHVHICVHVHVHIYVHVQFTVCIVQAVYRDQ